MPETAITIKSERREKSMPGRSLLPASLLLPFLIVGTGFACVVPIPRPIPRPIIYKPKPLSIEELKTEVIIKANLSRVLLEQVFYNPNPRQIESELVFPVPRGASVENFSMFIDGKEVKAEMLDAEKARKIYLDIVRKLKDPALLEYIDRQSFRVRIFPVPGNGRRKIKLSYTQLLHSEGGMYEFVYPMRIGKLAPQPIGQVSLKINVDSELPLRSIYSPTHEVEITRKGERRAVVGFEAKSLKPDRNFKLYIVTEKSPVALRVLSYRDGNEPGFFMLITSPALKEAQVIPKDIVFVIDTSGSMGQAEDRLTPAKNALKFCIRSLRNNDRFNIVRFSTEAEAFANELLAGTQANKSKALKFIDRFRASGGTAIDDALRLALKFLQSKERPSYVVFLTDGEPTIGITSVDEIVQRFKKNNSASARVFVLGVGTAVNTNLLDALAEETKGFPEYILPDEDIEIKISNFYGKVSAPVLTDLGLQAREVKLSDVYPRPLPDLFKGSELIALGRYEGKGTTDFVLKGRRAGKPVSFSASVNLASEATSYDFIPRLWAQRKVAYLITQIRRVGKNKELIDEVAKLAKRYGIITPYTSYLIIEDEKQVARRGARRLLEPELASAPALEQKRAFDRAMKATGAGAVRAAREIKEKRISIVVSQPKAGRALPTQKVKYIGEKTFYFNGRAWVDSVYQTAKLPEVKVSYISDEYFELLSKEPELGKYLSLGENVIVCYKGKAYIITSEG